ncbi:MAG TPA: zinc ribbon domain-containing protein [Blastocatellia bacterium]|nr:zinc ribbon domain-containing protein [Blastocatellia bacterium]
MFCPKCATENPDANRYCRACRENLQLVSQAMKGRAPVVLAGKVDQILDSRSERFRRDSLLNLLMFMAVLVGGLVSWQKGYSGPYSEPLFFIPLAILSARQALLEYRAYKRSLSPDFDWKGPDHEHRERVAHPDYRVFRGRSLADSDWRGIGQEDYRNTLGYRLGRSVRTLSLRLRRLLMFGSAVPPGLPQFAAGQEGANDTAMTAGYHASGSLSATASTARQRRATAAAAHSESFDQASHARYVADTYLESATGSIGRQLDSSNTGFKNEPLIIYCPVCGEANGSQPSRCGACGTSLGPIAERLKPSSQNARTAKLDRFIRAKAEGLVSASEHLSLSVSVGLVALTLLVGVWSSWSAPGWWYSLSLSIVVCIAHAWDRIAYRRISREQGSVEMNEHGMTRGSCARAEIFDSDERKPLHEWQRLYRGLWLLIEVTSEDEAGVSDGRLVATAEDRSAFRDLDQTYDERYLIAIYAGY